MKYVAKDNGINKPKWNKLWDVFLFFCLNKRKPGLSGIHINLKANKKGQCLHRIPTGPHSSLGPHQPPGEPH